MDCLLKRYSCENVSLLDCSFSMADGVVWITFNNLTMDFNNIARHYLEHIFHISCVLPKFTTNFTSTAHDEHISIFVLLIAQTLLVWECLPVGLVLEHCRWCMMCCICVILRLRHHIYISWNEFWMKTSQWYCPLIARWSFVCCNTFSCMRHSYPMCIDRYLFIVVLVDMQYSPIVCNGDTPPERIHLYMQVTKFFIYQSCYKLLWYMIVPWYCSIPMHDNQYDLVNLQSRIQCNCNWVHDHYTHLHIIGALLFNHHHIHRLHKT